MKAWTRDIAAHIDHWTGKCRSLGYKWAPKFAYHFTDVHNAASILSSGALLSRALATAQARMVNDNAAEAIIASTPEPHTRFARLYFRPRTPTQYRNEGISPPANRYQGAHCPVPVFFCFDLLPILSQDNVEFSNGSMARPDARHGSTQPLFNSIPFDKVYHDGPLPNADKVSHIFHRHAEVLVPDQLPLTHLVAIACRSAAERSTLIHLLPPPARLRWAGKTHCVGNALFYRHKSFVESVTAVDGALHVNFHYPHVIRNSKITIRGEERTSGRIWSWSGSLVDANLTLRIPGGDDAHVMIQVDDAIAFRGDLQFGDDVPF